MKKNKIINLFVTFSFIIAMAFTFFNGNVKYAYANNKIDKVSGSIINIDNNGTFKNNFKANIANNKNVHMYFGNNLDKNDYGNKKHKGAVKWRILSSEDSKYSNGNMLLFADYSLAKLQYNNNASNVFWNNSSIKSFINGDLTDKLFNAKEKALIKQDKQFETLNFGVNYNNAPYAYTNNVVGDKDGQFKQDDIDNAGAKTVNTSVVENSKSNSLFLLDYQDINNADYGFSDGKDTYATKVIADWTYNNGVYPVNFNDRSVNMNELAFDFLSDNSSAYWLRPAGIEGKGNGMAIVVADTGYVTVADAVKTYGVRPALSLSSDSIIYASATEFNTTNTFKTIEKVNADASAYKMFFKTNEYINYNQNDKKPEIIAKKNGFVVNTDIIGKAIAVLTEKSNPCNVKYQAVAEIEDGVASFSLPENAVSSDYDINLLFVDGLNGENSCEYIKGSYVTAYPTYTASEYEVKFVDEKGEIIKNVIVKKDSIISADTIPDNPVKENTEQYTYQFDGWYNGDVKWNFNDNKVNSDIILKAVFTETVNKYKVTFDGKNEVEVEYGSKLKKPDDPVQESDELNTYQFDGWYNGETKWNFENDTVTENLELKSVFLTIKKKYTVTFDGKNGVEVEAGSKVTAPSVPVKPDDEQYVYKFDGWYNGDIKWDFNNNVVKSDINLISKFKSEIKSFKIIIGFEGLEKEIKVINAKYGDLIDFNTFNEEGYTYEVFVNGEKVDSVTINGEMRINVKYKKVKKGCGSSLDGTIALFAFPMLLAFGYLIKKRNMRGNKI